MGLPQPLSENRGSKTGKMKLRLVKWILYAPVAALPLLAALVLGGDSTEGGLVKIAESNWVWLLTALGLGIWFGWATNTRNDA